jgi:4,5-DOPA dioxygenase extradiol
MEAAMSATPVLYLSHGAPPLADDVAWRRQLADWSAELPRPKAILIVSAHWEEAPVTLGATTTAPLVYDFWGFPERYYQVTYPAPGAPELASKVRKLLHGPRTPVHDAPDRGLDHGAYVPLVEMYPDADIPVLDPRELYALGQKLKPLRDEGVLIIGSGFFTHNLSAMRQVDGTRSLWDGRPPLWSAEFDQWGDEMLRTGDVDALLDFQRTAPAATLAHPRIEHFAPLFVSLGAGAEDVKPETVIDGYWYGLAKRSIQLG